MARAKVDYKPNRGGMRAVLNSGAMCDRCTAEARKVAARANGMFDASGYQVSPGRAGKNRAHALVYTGDLHTMRSNRLHNTLQKSLD